MNGSLKDTTIQRWDKVKSLLIAKCCLGATRVSPGLLHTVGPAAWCPRAPPRAGSPAEATGSRAPRARPAPPPAGVMDGRGAGGLSGLIDEVRADGRRVTRGGRRRARGGGRAQTRRRSGSAPAGRPRPCGAPGPGSAEGAAGEEARPGPGARARPRFLSAGASLPAPAPSPSWPQPSPGAVPPSRSPLSRSTAPATPILPGRQGRARVQAAAAARAPPGDSAIPAGRGAPLRRDSAAANVAEAAQFRRRTVGFRELVPRDARGEIAGRR